MSDFIHLHNHTDYSLLDGAASIVRLVARAKQLGMDALAITDHGNMFGALDFYNECKRNNVKPIIGNEFYMAPTSMKLKSGSEDGNKYYHLILLAKDAEGYANLMKLTSISYLEGFYYKPRIDFETLKKYHNGLICLSACIAGLVPSLLISGKESEAEKWALEYDALFGRGNFYLEMQDHGLAEEKVSNQGLLKISQKTGIPVAATNDIHYVNENEAEAQEILICIGTQKKLSDENRLMFDSKEFYMKTPQQMKQLFSYAPQAIENTKVIAEKCCLELKLPGPQLPDFEIPSEFTSPADYLRHLTYNGLKKRYTNITQEIEERVEYELNTIIKMEFTGYFLIVWDFIKYALEHDIPVGPGRGSGAGSVVAYALNITNIDPFKYNLLFERFLNPERISMPDFDIDFCYERRQEVIDYVTAKYGNERVGQIITFGTLKPKAVLKDVARVLDISFDESNRITKLVPGKLTKSDDDEEEDDDSKKITLDKAIEESDELKQIFERGGVYKTLYDVSKVLEGLKRHCSLHAAGIVIGKEKLIKYVPLYKDTKTGAVSTQFTMGLLEKCGLVKMDFLGLKTLTLIKNCEDLIKKRIPDFSIQNIPDNDKKTFKMLGEGKNTCIFQFEKPHVKKYLKDLKPESIEDLIALNALNRPGPAKNIPQFINSKNGKMKIEYPHESLAEILKPTYGVIVYQEQVMKVAQIIAGFTLGKADILRRAMGKKDAKTMASMKDDFISGTINNGYTEELANNIFEMLIPFADYGFNKSHAAVYAVLAYQTAYLKANYPVEFMAANLTNEINNTEKLSEYISETRSMGIEILPPDINLSDKYFTVENSKIFYGLVGIKNVGTAAVEDILSERKKNGAYKNFNDFLNRIDLRVINKKVLEVGIKCGVFDSIEKGRRAIFFNNLEKLVDAALSEQENKKYGQTMLFGSDSKDTVQDIELEESNEWPEKELLDFEKENLGFYFSGHPLKKYKTIYDKSVTLRINNIESADTNRIYTVIGIVTEIKLITTKKMQQMATIKIETFETEIPIVIFPKVWENYQNMISNGKILAFHVKVDKSRSETQLICDKVINPEELKEIIFKEMHFAFFNNLTAENLELLKSFLLENNGSCGVFFHIWEANKETVIKANHVNIISDNGFIQQVKQYPFVKSVWKE